jgi:hypothetical protein
MEMMLYACMTNSLDFEILKINTSKKRACEDSSEKAVRNLGMA